MKYLTNYVPQGTGGMSAGYVVVEDNGVLKAQKLTFDGTTPQFDGVAEEIADVGIFETGLDEPAYNGGGGGGTAKYYKCASVDTANKTWSGYELVLQDDVYAISDVLTEGLTYNGFTPIVGNVYTEDGFIEVKAYYQGFVLVSPTDMTSNENDEWLITASSYTHPPYYAFNGNENNPSGWNTADYTSPPHWIQWQNKNTKSKILSYSLQASNNVPEDLTPNTWVLYGSNNGSDWVVVDERTNAITGATNFETFTFICQNPGSYYYYKLYITEPLPRSYACIGQIKTYGQFE